MEALESRRLLSDPSSLAIAGTMRNPVAPAENDAVWIASTVSGSPASVNLQYLISGGTATVFQETMGIAAVKPWTGASGSDNSWTVTGSYFDLNTGANYVTSTSQCGLTYKGKSTTNTLTGAMVATANGINAVGTSGYVEFYVKSQTLDGTDGWTFQLDSGSGYVTRLSELTGSSHAYQKYHYDLGAGELVNGLKLRFQFTGGGAGDLDDRISVDQITVTVNANSTPASAAMLDDGAHGDGAAGDGVYGGQIPAAAAGRTVSYYVTAIDAQGQQVSDPAGAPGAAYSYTVVHAGPFDGNIVLGCPTNNSVTLNVLSLDQDREVYFVYGTTSGSYSGQTARYALSAGSPLVVTLGSLSADTQYYYRMMSKPAGTSESHITGTEEYQFHTQRAPGSTFTFAIQGDSHPERVNAQFDADLYAQTLLAAKADHPDFYLTIGDDFSVDQLVQPFTQADVANRYLIQRPYLGLIGNSAPLFLVNGNHEQAARYLLDGTPNNPAIWAQNARNLYYSEPAPGSDNTFNTGFYTGNTETVQFINGDYLRNYFAWQWGDALFVTIDPYWSSPTCVDDPLYGGPKRTNLWDIQHGDAQYNWLKTTLQNSTAKYKFVFAHHVLGTGRGGADEAGGYEWGGENANGTWGFGTNRPGWTLPIHQLMATSGVTAFIQGHDHIFVDQQLDGVHYITLPEPADPNYYLYNSDAFQLNVQAKASNTGYTRFTVAPDGVKVEYVRTFLPGDEVFGRASGVVVASVTLAPAAGMPVITGQVPTPTAPTPSTPVWVAAKVTDNSSVAGVVLSYNAGAGPVGVTMLDDGLHGDGVANDHVYGGQIPAQAAGTLVRYTITATDNEGHQATNAMCYTVAPSIGATAIVPGVPQPGNVVWVTSTITDDIALGIVNLTYSASNGTPVAVKMFDDGAHGDGAAGDHVYGAQIPAQAAGTLVRYSVSAVDSEGTAATGTTQTYTVSSTFSISDTRTIPSQPEPNEPAWVTAAISGTPTSVNLYYNAGAVSAAFLETFGPPPTSNQSPWSGGGVANPWTVTASSPASVSLMTSANGSAIDTTGGCGVRFLGGTIDPLQTMIATTSGIDARGFSGTVQFYVKTSALEGTDGWAFQLDAGSGYVTRLSELVGSIHGWRLYSYNLQTSELVSGLKMRFQFQGGDADDQVQVDHVSLVVKPYTVVSMADDGAHGDGAAGDGIFGGQIPGLSIGTKVNYFIQAQDGTGTVLVDPAGAPTSVYSYTVGYPFDVMLGRPTNDSIAVSVMSRASESVTFYVAYGTSSGSYTQQAAPWTLSAGAVKTLDLTGLQSNAQYYYRVYYQLAGSTLFKPGPEQSFHTQRPANATFTFDVQADFHYTDPDTNNSDVYAATVGNMLADRPDFLIDLGDTFMTEKFIPDPTTSAVMDQTARNLRTSSFSQFGGSVPLFLVTGNHDSELGWMIDPANPTSNRATWSTDAREQYFPSPVPGGFFSGSSTIDPYVQEKRDSYYSFTWGNAQFIVLDPYWYTDPKPGLTDGGWGWTLGQSQYNWLAQTLAASQAPLKFVFIHHLVGGDYDGEARGGVEFSKFTEWGGYNQDGTWGFDTHRPGWAMPIQSLLLKYGVDVVFHGHDHLFVKENLDANADGATDLVYLECPQPASPIYNSTTPASGYGYLNYASDSAGNSGLQGSSGHIRVTVSATSATIEYVRAYAAADQSSQRVNGAVSYSFGLSAPTDITLSNSTVAENQPIGTTVGTLSTTDPDTGNTFTYSLVNGTGADDNASFAISGNSLVTTASFNYEAKSSYSVRIRSTDQGGLYTEKVFAISVTNIYEGSIAGRKIFYNASYFDGNNALANASDDAAIDTSKTALLPGGTASFANHTAYSKGINGIMVDLLGLANAAGLSASDFDFKVGNSSTPSAWSTAPAPSSISVRSGAGTGGSDRITLIWANNVIQKQWLQVTVKSTANTDLATPNVFYFGNAIGETGNSATNAYVDGTDFVGVRDHPRNFTNRAPVTYAYDLNKDSFVDGSDLVIARDNTTNFVTVLKLITPPLTAAAAPATLSLASTNSAGTGSGNSNTASSAVFSTQPVALASAPAILATMAGSLFAIRPITADKDLLTANREVWV